MLGRILPKQFDGAYRGHALALWMLWPITLLDAAISLTAIFKRDGGAQASDGIPLDSFGSGGAAAVIHIVALLGLANLMLCLVIFLALLRYRAMIPLVYALILLDDLGHRTISLFKPVASAGGSPATYVDFALTVLTMAGLILSLLGRGYGRDGVARTWA